MKACFPNPHFEHAVDQRFTPFHGPPHVISRIIKQKFDKPWLSWKKVWLEVHDLWFREFKKEYRWDPSQEQTIRFIFEQKGSHIYKNTMNKIRNDHNRAIWIQASVRTILDEH
ncbi:hypothetical protein CR513_60732, partial [Mucuna pruriens]